MIPDLFKHMVIQEIGSTLGVCDGGAMSNYGGYGGVDS